MNRWVGLLVVWLLAVLMMCLGWRWQRLRENASIVDVLWAAGLGGAAVLLALLGDGTFAPRILLALCGGAWGLRLAAYLARRMRGAPEDGRYRALRQRWHGHQRKLFGMFQFQAMLIPLFALPFVAVAANPKALPIPLLLGALVWLGAVTGEAIADVQLAHFRADAANHGKTCRSGLWRYSRHPNYFFEWLHWFTYVLFAVGSPLWWLAFVGPVVMYVFLRYLSGIPFTEAHALEHRGEDYRDYQRTTSALFPWFPKHTEASMRITP